MKKIKTIIIDDEQDAIDVLRILLEEHCPEIDVVASANSVNAGLELIEKDYPDLVFLDIEMPGKNGFEVFRSLDDIKFQTIVVTGYENYAIRAIKYSALDYLLKPIDIDDLIQAVARIEPRNSENDNRLMHLNDLLLKKIEINRKLMVPYAQGFKNVALEEIIHIESKSGNYSIFYLRNGRTEVICKALTYFEDLLPNKIFFRINRSQLINLNYVNTFKSATGEVVLDTGLSLTVSTRKRKYFRDRMNGLLQK